MSNFDYLKTDKFPWENATDTSKSLFPAIKKTEFFDFEKFTRDLSEKKLEKNLERIYGNSTLPKLNFDSSALSPAFSVSDRISVTEIDETYDDEEDDWEDKMPSVCSVVSLVASFFCPFLLPVAALVIGNDAQKRTQRSKAKRIAKKITNLDTDFLLDVGQERRDLKGARLTHTFTVDESTRPCLFGNFNTGVVTEEIDYRTGKIKRNIDVI
ncbi:hypothetical protein KKC83_05680 [Patescibacteria group bacterium]|nr:hypothetical protein [Candidatus Falkowbacteria bacterium]MBU3906594.1 hypothetical protein [Patescibacteria group bacterium]MCG2698723.1 hypothetical protein [Candidatus Parcubacteria bacterium]MBU4014582.1 hypothetical protein [Patescibacteria group bacterium]MBU4027006.1 hypothetical protein [Patescibacteria group bacterium]